MLTRAQIEQALMGYDQIEREMQRTLENLAAFGSKADYKAYERACTRAMKQIEARRRMFSRYLA